MINLYSYTSQGPRPTNQDSILAQDIAGCGLLCCVADGVGGNQGGEVASKLALDVVLETLKNSNKTTLSEAFQTAHEKILAKANSDDSVRGMATTITAIVLEGSKLSGANCGDSRTYLLRGNGIQQLSKDHSEVARLLSTGKLTKETAVDYPRKNILDSALGAHKPLQIHEYESVLEPGDRVVLVSDGVSSVISKKDFRDISKRFPILTDFGSYLINLVNERETKDNYSLVMIEV
ncbi:Serine/threonine phosphatase stp [Serratia liquefaciens]|nr:Serine/threonine phosphatase stp [Serratia liquefaciens]